MAALTLTLIGSGHMTGTGSGQIDVAISQDVAVGEALIVVIHCDVTPTAPQIVVGGVAGTALALDNTGLNTHCGVYHSTRTSGIGALVAGTHTVRLTVTADDGATIHLFRATGLDTAASPVDGAVRTAEGTVNTASANVTNTRDNALYLGTLPVGIAPKGSALPTWTPGSGWTAITAVDETAAGSFILDLRTTLAYQVVSSIAARSLTGTLSTFANVNYAESDLVAFRGPDPATVRDLLVTVTDACTNLPLAGATVSLTGESDQTTDAAGQVTFVDALLGSHDVTVAKATYTTYGPSSITIGSSDPNTLDVVLTPTAGCPDGAGPGDRNSDLVTVQAGMVFRSYRNTSNVKVSCVFGATITIPTVATDCDYRGTPTLCRGPDDTLFCWYHTSAGAAKCRRSADYGQNWTDHVTLAATKKWPKMALLGDLSYLIAYDGTDLKVYQSGDYCLTVPDVIGTFTDGAEGRATLLVGPNGWLHAVYKDDTGALVRKYWDGLSWSIAYTLASPGTQPAFALGLPRSLFAYWDATPALQLRYLDEGLALGSALAAPGVTYEPSAYLGAVVDERGLMWIDGKVVSGSVVGRWSRDDGAAWNAIS